MTTTESWLPRLVVLDDYGGNWEGYLEAIYTFFKADFLDDWPFYEGDRVTVTREPYYRGLEAGFWHITSEGPIEEERTPDLRRCERIRWPRPVVEHAHDPELKVWTERRKGQTRIHLWVESEGYVVVLTKRSGYYVLWTAFLTAEGHQRKKLRRRFEDASKG